MARSLRELEIDAFLARGEAIAQLCSHPAWPAYLALLHDMRQAALERCADPDETQLGYWQGVAAALGEIMDRPVRIVDAAADYQRTEEAEKQVIRTDLRAAIGMGVDRDGDI